MRTRGAQQLLLSCFKTGRMDPYDRQRPKRVVREHRPNDRQQSRSTASSPPRSTTGRKDGTLATRGTRCDCPRSDPSRGSRAVTVRSRDSRPTFHGTSDAQFRPTLTRAQEKCDGGETRARDHGLFGSANPEPHAGRRLNLEGNIAESTCLLAFFPRLLFRSFLLTESLKKAI